MKILVIQQKRIGDVLTSTILSNNLRQFYPDAIIDYMCYPNCVDVLLENPNINNIIVLSNAVRKSYPSLFKFIFEIRNNNYDVVIDAYSKLETNLITLFSGAKFKISYDKGYSKLFYNHNIKRIKNGTKSEFKLDRAFMKKVGEAKSGEKLIIENLNFVINTFAVVNESRGKLYELLLVLQKNPSLKIEIQGHICCMSVDRADLSTQRAKALYNFLLNQNISKDRLSYKGFGSSQPIYALPEKDEQERAANRRVEILILEN